MPEKETSYRKGEVGWYHLDQCPRIGKCRLQCILEELEEEPILSLQGLVEFPDSAIRTVTCGLSGDSLIDELSACIVILYHLNTFTE